MWLYAKKLGECSRARVRTFGQDTISEINYSGNSFLSSLQLFARTRAPECVCVNYLDARVRANNWSENKILFPK